MFVIEDEIHAEWVGEYADRAAAVAELRRLAKISWDQPPNVAPCMSWRTCGRNYELIEYDASTLPWKELGRSSALVVRAEGARWLLE